MKWHISKDGTPKKCTAKFRACRLTGSHHSTEIDAWLWKAEQETPGITLSVRNKQTMNTKGPKRVIEINVYPSEITNRGNYSCDTCLFTKNGMLAIKHNRSSRPLSPFELANSNSNNSLNPITSPAQAVVSGLEMAESFPNDGIREYKIIIYDNMEDYFRQVISRERRERQIRAIERKKLKISE